MITIKRMSECTFAEVTKAWNRGFEGYYIPVTMTEESLVQRLGAEGYVMSLSVVAFDGTEPVGLVANGLRMIGDQKVAWNGGTGVATEYRRQGVGRLLIQATLDLYREAGMDVATLEALSQNEKAIALYEQLGYRVDDRLLFWQRMDALPEQAFGEQVNSPYQVRAAWAQEVAALPFYRADVPWQNQWQSLRDAQTLLVEDQSGQVVGYAMYKSVLNEEGTLSAIVLRQCVAQSGHPDAKNILATALAKVYAPYELVCRRSTFNLRASDEMLFELLEGAGFTSSGTEQVYMSKQMEKGENP
ncbi:GNAT family N-acetyltransferase [Brevibacillus sp. NRS-1366]|uniref:GNAT family N-acetyltransferase n=1 Tax=Brevibacillus sp. NRS-1366 TaxID=3233899 RepID=UPI003D2510D7